MVCFGKVFFIYFLKVFFTHENVTRRVLLIFMGAFERFLFAEMMFRDVYPLLDVIEVCSE